MTVKNKKLEWHVRFRGSREPSNRLTALLIRPDAVAFIQSRDKDLAIANIPFSMLGML